MKHKKGVRNGNGFITLHSNQKTEFSTFINILAYHYYTYN